MIIREDGTEQFESPGEILQWLLTHYMALATHVVNNTANISFKDIETLSVMIQAAIDQKDAEIRDDEQKKLDNFFKIMFKGL